MPLLCVFYVNWLHIIMIIVIVKVLIIIIIIIIMRPFLIPLLCACFANCEIDPHNLHCHLYNHHHHHHNCHHQVTGGANFELEMSLAEGAGLRGGYSTPHTLANR